MQQEEEVRMNSFKSNFRRSHRCAFTLNCEKVHLKIINVYR
jgi:hypothetical protein